MTRRGRFSGVGRRGDDFVRNTKHVIASSDRGRERKNHGSRRGRLAEFYELLRTDSRGGNNGDVTGDRWGGWGG